MGKQDLATRLHLPVFSLILHPLPSLINNCLNLPTGTQGRSWKLKEGCCSTRPWVVSQLGLWYFDCLSLDSHRQPPQCTDTETGVQRNRKFYGVSVEWDMSDLQHWSPDCQFMALANLSAASYFSEFHNTGISEIVLFIWKNIQKELWIFQDRCV